MNKRLFIETSPLKYDFPSTCKMELNDASFETNNRCFKYASPLVIVVSLLVPNTIKLEPVINVLYPIAVEFTYPSASTSVFTPKNVRLFPVVFVLPAL